ncbi:hypothetical protein DYU05_13920 [Mucilaginibacter terrenus]|uniref:Uncharacterized protein n=1 Tax=Mucilaginibacter terrenus TaxID=2482727 RepID=A0A3E2NQG2_9SPHI|nr:hypothetical protein [Mucilaginibacter terrenus]RFZ83232.1 hypothetical protein DYU05_13920 [Mucilaginibacter terrenus]
MFSKLYTLVKNNAGEAVINNPAVDAKYHEAVMNDASSTIIEVLKGQMENGKLKELVKYFQFTGIYNSPLISSAVNKFANKLDKFYQISPAQAMEISKALIPPVMQEMIKQSKSEQNKDFALRSILTKLGGDVADMGMLLAQLKIA